jgi:hypothetical protein
VRSGLDSLAVEWRTRRVRGRDDLPWHDGPFSVPTRIDAPWQDRRFRFPARLVVVRQASLIAGHASGNVPPARVRTSPAVDAD